MSELFLMVWCLAILLEGFGVIAIHRPKVSNNDSDEVDYPVEGIVEEDGVSTSSQECNVDSISHFDLLFDDIEFDRYIYKRMRDTEDEDYDNRITKIMRTWFND